MVHIVNRFGSGNTLVLVVQFHMNDVVGPLLPVPGTRRPRCGADSVGCRENFLELAEPVGLVVPGGRSRGEKGCGEEQTKARHGTEGHGGISNLRHEKELGVLRHSPTILPEVPLPEPSGGTVAGGVSRERLLP